MKKYVILLLVLIGLAVQAKPLATTTPERQNEWWYLRHENILKRVAAEPDKIDIVLIGDSITHGWDHNMDVFNAAVANCNVLNLGFSADRTENVLWRLRNGEIKGLSPKVAMIMVGTNNSGHRKDLPNNTALGIEYIIEEVRKEMPETKILLLGIFPRGENRDDQFRKINDEINKILPSLADNKNIFFLNINDKFMDEDGVISKTIMPDRLHLSKDGFRIWMDGVAAFINENMK